MAGEAGGAMQGAQTGAKFGPWGAAIGAVAGGIMGGNSRRKAREANRAQRKEMRRELDRDVQEMDRESNIQQSQDRLAVSGSGVDSSSGTVQSQAKFMARENTAQKGEHMKSGLQDIKNFRKTGKIQQKAAQRQGMVDTISGLNSAYRMFKDG